LGQLGPKKPKISRLFPYPLLTFSRRVSVAFEVIDSHVVYEGRVFSLRQDRLRMPDGRLIQLDIVSHNGAVTVLPVDADGQIWFIRQYRHATGEELLELPAGAAEASEDPWASAQRELREETGMAAAHLERIGGFFLAPGYSTEYMHVYLATGLTPSPLPQDEDELLRIEKISARHAMRLAEEGVLQDSKSLIALFWARPYLERLGLLAEG
jgi:ADP-ribose pyrophosphatase